MILYNTPQSLGRITGPLQLGPDGNPELLYGNGEMCTADNTFSTRITFLCDRDMPVSLVSDLYLGTYFLILFEVLGRVCNRDLCQAHTPSSTASYQSSEVLLLGTEI